MDDKYFQNFKKTFIDNINNAIYLNGWNLRILSEKSDIPYDSLKKVLNGKINNPSISSIIKLSTTLNCSIDSLLGLESDNQQTNKTSDFSDLPITSLPTRAVNLLREIATLESYLANVNNTSSTCYIPVITPTGLQNYNMIYDSFYLDKINLYECDETILDTIINVSGYQNSIADNILCGLRITSDALLPTYFTDDILLISKDRYPVFGETGIFIKDNNVYVRKYMCGSPTILQSVNGIGSPVIMDNINEWHFCGRVLTVMRKPS